MEQAPFTVNASTLVDKHIATVLVVDDTPENLTLMGALLRDHFMVKVANNGEKALKIAISDTLPGLVLLDILLPGIDGATLITTLRSHPQFSRSRLIVVTSLDEQQREPYAFALQGVKVIHKPRLVAELPAALAACFPQAQATA